MSFDKEMGICMCKNGLFNGTHCLECSGGRVLIDRSTLCVCPVNSLWDGQKCTELCKSPLIYHNGACNCPLNTYLEQGQCINTPICQNNMIWFNSRCVMISCEVGYHWNGHLCINSDVKCAPNSYYDGQECIFYNLMCPRGT